MPSKRKTPPTPPTRPTSTTARKRGRPSAYRPEFAGQAFKLALLGATDVRLADFFGVALSTVSLWKVTHPDFSGALKAGKDEADAAVAKSLYRRALGYSHRAVKIYADPKTGAEVQVPYTERYAPDTTAAIFWLKNRQPEQWRDRQEHTGPNGDPIRHEHTHRQAWTVAGREVAWN